MQSADAQLQTRIQSGQSVSKGLVEAATFFGKLKNQTRLAATITMQKWRLGACEMRKRMPQFAFISCLITMMTRAYLLDQLRLKSFGPKTVDLLGIQEKLLTNEKRLDGLPKASIHQD
jgi:hypothetical protein